MRKLFNRFRRHPQCPYAYQLFRDARVAYEKALHAAKNKARTDLCVRLMDGNKRLCWAAFSRSMPRSNSPLVSIRDPVSGALPTSPARSLQNVTDYFASISGPSQRQLSAAERRTLDDAMIRGNIATARCRASPWRWWLNTATLV